MPLRDTYVPPRQAWNQGPGRNFPREPSPLNSAGRPAELPGDPAVPPQPHVPAAGEYYEDVDPRFAEPLAVHQPTPPPVHTTSPQEDNLQRSRSPAESERSTFTSISQRGVNPRWNPPVPAQMVPGSGGNMASRRPVNHPPADVLLNSNPDFDLPSRGGAPRPAGAMIPDSAYPTGTL